MGGCTGCMWRRINGMDNKPSTDEGLRELALFAGAGGGILGGKLLGWRTVCAVEYEPHAAAILAKRQNDEILRPFPIWDDVRTFDGRPWRGRVDVVSGGFPCQDISCAGSGKGLEGERSGLWSEMARIIGEVRPRYALVENSPMLTGKGLGRVLGDLAEMGYNAKWGVLGAYHSGLDINRERIWIVAGPFKKPGGVFSWWPDQKCRDMGNNIPLGSQVDRFLEELERQGAKREDQGKNSLPSYLCGMGDGLALELDELKRIGNGQIPQVVRLAWRILSNEA